MLPLALIAVFISVALATGLVVSNVLERRSPERRRLEQVTQRATMGLLSSGPSLGQRETGWSAVVTRLLPKSKKETERLRRRLGRAGLTSLKHVAIYSAAEIVLPVGLAAGSLMLGTTGMQRVAIFVLAGFLGRQLPSYWVERQVKKRRLMIQRGLPDALDLLIVCLEAGSAIDQALVKVSDELSVAYPPLAEELRLIITETRAGKRRIDAFRSFAERTNVDDVRALVAMLIQSDRFGTSIAQALRTQAESSRTERRQRVEEQAAKIGAKLAFPLVLLIFPAFFIVAVGPAVISFVNVFLNR